MYMNIVTYQGLLRQVWCICLAVAPVMVSVAITVGIIVIISTRTMLLHNVGQELQFVLQQLTNLCISPIELGCSRCTMLSFV